MSVWEKYKTDKATVHTYDHIYPLLLRGLPDDSYILEVGVKRGGSLLLWKELAPQCKIIGVDIIPRPECLPDDITYHSMDAYSEESINKLTDLYGGKCSLIIDDGSHLEDDLAIFAERYPIMLQSGGIIVLEDIPGDRGIKAVFPKMPNEYHPFVVDVRMIKKQANDLMIIGWCNECM